MISYLYTVWPKTCRSHTIQWETLTDAWLFSDIGLIDFQVRVVPAVVLAWLKTVLSAIQGWNPHSHRNPHSQEISFFAILQSALFSAVLGCKKGTLQNWLLTILHFCAILYLQSGCSILPPGSQSHP